MENYSPDQPLTSPGPLECANRIDQPLTSPSPLECANRIPLNCPRASPWLCFKGAWALLSGLSRLPFAWDGRSRPAGVKPLSLCIHGWWSVVGLLQDPNSNLKFSQQVHTRLPLGIGSREAHVPFRQVQLQKVAK